MRIKLFILTFLFLFFGASPTFANNAVINEFMAHPSTGNSEWIEFYNPDNIDLSSYWIDDDTLFSSDSGNSTIKSLSSLNITTSSFPYIELSSFLNNPGDHVVLFSNDGTILDQYQYTSDPGADVTMGRSPDGGNWIVLASSSKGSSNGEQQSLLTPTPTPTPLPTTSPTHTPIPTKTPTLTPTPKKSVSPTINPTPTPTPSPKNTPIPTINSDDSSTPETANKISYRIASVAGAQASATPEAKVEVKDQKQINPFFWAGLIFIFAGVSSIGYIYIKKNAKLHIWFRR